MLCEKRRLSVCDVTWGNKAGLTEMLAASIFKWSCSVMSNSLQPHGLYSSWNSPGQNTEVCSLSLLQGIFPTQGSNPGLSHCRQILYQLSHKGSPLMVCIIQKNQREEAFFNIDQCRPSCISQDKSDNGKPIQNKQTKLSSTPQSYISCLCHKLVQVR